MFFKVFILGKEIWYHGLRFHTCQNSNATKMYSSQTFCESVICLYLIVY